VALWDQIAEGSINEQRIALLGLWRALGFRARGTVIQHPLLWSCTSRNVCLARTSPSPHLEYCNDLLKHPQPESVYSCYSTRSGGLATLPMTEFYTIIRLGRPFVTTTTVDGVRHQNVRGRGHVPFLLKYIPVAKVFVMAAKRAATERPTNIKMAISQQPHNRESCN